MKYFACTALATLSLLLAYACSGFAANDVYYPYQSYDAYHKKHTSPEPPQNLPPAPALPETKVKPPLRPEQPIKLTQAPEFLFPAVLGFGVAVGVPYDLFYLSDTDTFYLLKSGTWYRATSYRGPWITQGLSRVPPELRKHDLKKIREVRNREFALFWKNKDAYKGRYFRPEDGAKADRPHDPIAPLPKEPKAPQGKNP